MGFRKFLITSSNGADIKSCPNVKCTTVGRGEYGEYLEFKNEHVEDANGTQWVKVVATNGNVGWVQSYKGAPL
ncbi:hypothetical protein [Clostridium sp.]|uniref:hypothetical protein n=1 Tax=Clostridium sp. TaxID=1506 RepID=UPI0034648E6B